VLREEEPDVPLFFGAQSLGVSAALYALSRRQIAIDGFVGINGFRDVDILPVY